MGALELAHGIWRGIHSSSSRQFHRCCWGLCIQVLHMPHAFGTVSLIKFVQLSYLKFQETSQDSHVQWLLAIDQLSSYYKCLYLFAFNIVLFLVERCDTLSKRPLWNVYYYSLQKPFSPVPPPHPPPNEIVWLCHWWFRLVHVPSLSLSCQQSLTVLIPKYSLRIDTCLLFSSGPFFYKVSLFSSLVTNMLGQSREIIVVFDFITDVIAMCAL